MEEHWCCAEEDTKREESRSPELPEFAKKKSRCASSPLKNSSISSSVLTANPDATMAPAEAPDTTRGRNPCSKRALMTPVENEGVIHTV